MKPLLGPHQTILVTTRGEVSMYGKQKLIDNIIPVDWHMPCSFEPFMYAICVKKTHLTYTLIKTTKVWVVNFIPVSMKEAVLICGKHSGLHVDKFKESKLIKLNASTIDCCKVSGALGYLECELEQEIDCNDHVLFIGKVHHKEFKFDHQRLFHCYEDVFTTTKITDQHEDKQKQNS